MRRGYLSRRIAENVSQHTVPTRVQPTGADFSSTLYNLVYVHPPNGHTVGILVLAFNEDHADTLGGMRLAAMGVDATTLTLRSCTPAHYSVELLESVLGFEGAEEREDRQRRYARTEDGPDPLRTPGVEGGVCFDYLRR